MATVTLTFLVLLSSLLLALTLAADPAKQHCSEQCSTIEVGHRREECEQECLKWYGGQHGWKDKQEGEQEQNEQQENPYFFDKQRFKHRSKTQHGSFKVLERFSKRSDLLQAIANHRFAVMEANPRTFIIPSHWDTEEVFYVIGGKGVITILLGENRETLDIRRGDIMRIPAGAIVYLINTDDSEKLRIALLLQPISIPGHFKEFYPAGGDDPESYFKSFSDEVLEAAFNTRREKIQRLFGRQEKGEFIQASEDQIKALRKYASPTGGRPFGLSPWRPFNLLDKKPSHSNQHGKLLEASSNDFKRLREVDVDVSIANITSGSMMVPNFNTKATKIAFVMKGKGLVQMACPHLSKGGKGAKYKRVRAELTPGTVFVIPAGHPVAVMSTSGGENLEVLCFGLWVEGNRKMYLTGMSSVMKGMVKEAKELSFDERAEVVEEVLGAQEGDVFVAGRLRQGERGRKEENSYELFIDRLMGF